MCNCDGGQALTVTTSSNGDVSTTASAVTPTGPKFKVIGGDQPTSGLSYRQATIHAGRHGGKVRAIRDG